MLIGHKFRLYPIAKEQSILRLLIGHQRFIYNAKTQEQDYWFKFYKHSLSLTNSSLGLVKQFIVYKAAKRNKLVLFVNPAYSSQECSECHFIHKDNRLTQSIFKCTSCGHEENADSNAAKVIKYRGIEFLKSFDLEHYKPKSKKTISIRKKVGKVLPEPILEIESKPVENTLDIKGINLSNVQHSMNQEIPITSSIFSGGSSLNVKIEL